MNIIPRRQSFDIHKLMLSFGRLKKNHLKVKRRISTCFMMFSHISDFQMRLPAANTE